MSNVILIGMPGAGKSTVGVVLAKKLGYSFTDSDLIIQQRTGKLLHQLIEEKGEAGFLMLENEINASLSLTHHVIATGGSAVYGKEAMEHLAKTGSVVYLKLPYEELKERLGDLHERGVVLKEGFTLCDLYEERSPLYEKYADITIDCQKKQIREIVEEISRKYEER
ncbi:MAG: shikimate kinase [Suilimivivens sp.]